MMVNIDAINRGGAVPFVGVMVQSSDARVVVDGAFYTG
ncbi:hypothetical protein PG5_19710 [Pseudomonas sp. G5(2012)]|nr:hypothetical protein PG5_19710 [Pseudomonas sp. G5(2012)]